VNLPSSSILHARCTCIAAYASSCYGFVTSVCERVAVAAAAAAAQVGNYSLSQITAPGTQFERWDCYSINTTSGNATLLSTSNATSPNITLTYFNVVTCVAVYSVLPPAPQLILSSDYGPAGANFTGPAASLFANTTGDSCTKAPSPRWGVDVNFTSPGVGLCGNNGTNNATSATVLVSSMHCRLHCWMGISLHFTHLGLHVLECSW
jgi:hypothetical protein